VSLPFNGALGGANHLRTFSPIPKRVMNGSEEGDVLPAAVLSGAPIELEARTVRYKSPNQKALHNSNK
jgi:NADH dehydrogenase (ubiquinone) Fe-S protein 4